MNIILGILFIFFSAVYAQAFETACHKYVQIDPVVEPSLTNPRCRVIDDVFYLEGAVDSQILYEIKTHYPDIRRMELNSYGGEVEAALELAFLIRERNIATNLRKGAKCSSACTLLFQAGVQRTAHHSVRVLYHPAHMGGRWFNDWVDLRAQRTREKWRALLSEYIFGTKEATERLFQAYQDYGMDPRFIAVIRSQKEDPNWFRKGNMDRSSDLIISVKELLQYNIVTELYGD